MFPHTITIYHHSIENGEDKYIKYILSGFYWNDEKSLSAADKGIKSTKEATIISNPENARKYGTEWNILPGDRVLLGIGENITSFKDLKEAVTVIGVAANVCNSDVDNVVIRGK